MVLPSLMEVSKRWESKSNLKSFHFASSSTYCCSLVVAKPAMARRNKGFLSDNDSSGESASDNDNEPDFDNDDQRDADSLFRNPYNNNRGKKRTREQLQEDATYGVWAQEDEAGEQRGGGRGVGSSTSTGGGGRRVGGAGGKKDYLTCELSLSPLLSLFSTDQVFLSRETAVKPSSPPVRSLPPPSRKTSAKTATKDRKTTSLRRSRSKTQRKTRRTSRWSWGLLMTTTSKKTS